MSTDSIDGNIGILSSNKKSNVDLIMQYIREKEEQIGGSNAAAEGAKTQSPNQIEAINKPKDIAPDQSIQGVTNIQQDTTKISPEALNGSKGNEKSGVNMQEFLKNFKSEQNAANSKYDSIGASGAEEAAKLDKKPATITAESQQIDKVKNADIDIKGTTDVSKSQQVVGIDKSQEAVTVDKSKDFRI